MTTALEGGEGSASRPEKQVKIKKNYVCGRRASVFYCKAVLISALCPNK
jgi:hypothetical protein